MRHTEHTHEVQTSPRDDGLLTLSQAGRTFPGTPSPNCVWRWCRRGVLSRSGNRIKLQHVRIGGKLFTSSRWLHEFGQRLAQADEAHFDQRETAEQSQVALTRSTQHHRVPMSGAQSVDQHRIEAELDAAGI